MALIEFQEHLRIDRCPFCGVDRPNLSKVLETWTANSESIGKRFWRAYVCGRCGGLVTAFIKEGSRYTDGIFPYDEGKRSKDIPERPRTFLEQAISSIHAPAGALMLAASSVDAMLKNKGYVDGSLYSRIDKAVKDQVITTAMAKWAHQVRLDANDQRHADDNAALPSEDDAKRAIAFTEALAQFLFVLPSMVDEGLKDSEPKNTK